MTRQRYNELVRKVNRITKVTTSGGIHSSRTPNGINLTGLKTKDTTPTHLTYMCGVFDDSLGSWITSENTAVTGTWNLYAAIGSGLSIDDYVQWENLILNKGTYDFYIGYTPITNGDTLDFYLDDELIGEVDTLQALPITPNVKSFKDFEVITSGSHTLKAIVTVAEGISQLVWFTFKKTA
jgi:hypothetical protein